MKSLTLWVGGFLNILNRNKNRHMWQREDTMNPIKELRWISGKIMPIMIIYILISIIVIR